MTKKIKIRNIDSLISAICKTLPPSSKEDLKVVNKLKLFIEKHTIIENDNKITDLNDKLFNKVVDISYLRRDLYKEILSEYKNWSNSVYNILLSRIQTSNLQYDDNYTEIDTSEFKDLKKINDMCKELLDRMNNVLIEKKNLRQTEKGIIKYFKAL